MAGASGNGSPASSIKWQVALAVGVPVAVGVGYWYYKNSRTTDNGDGYDSVPKTSGKSFENKDKLDTEPAADKLSRSPLQQALALKEEGNKHFKNGRYDEALECYQKAIDVGNEVDNKNLATFYQNKAAANEQLKHYDGVKQDCSMALSLNPQYTKALLRRAKAYEALKNLPKALEDITAACILENFQVQSTMITADRILKELGRVHAQEAIIKKKPIMPSIYFIKTYFSSFANDPIAPFDTNESANDAERGFLKAVSCLRRGDYDGVIGACTEELNQTEAEAGLKNEALVLRGTMYILTGQHSAALADLTAVVDNDDASQLLRVNALIKRASIHMQLEYPVKCLEDFNIAVAMDPNNADIYHQRGQVFLLMERLSEAQSDFELSVKLNPGNPITTVQKCYTDYRVCLSNKDEKKLLEVMDIFEEYIQKFPNCPECFTLYAQVLSDQQNFEKADDLYKNALKLDPENASLLVHRAILTLQWTSNVEEAIQLINQALQVDDKCGFACETLGTIQVQMGNLKEAIRMFDKAIELARTELELAHLYSLRDASIAQQAVIRQMNLQIPNMPS